MRLLVPLSLSFAVAAALHVPAPAHKIPSRMQPRAATPTLSASNILEVLVKRSDAGGLGIVCDQDNCIVSVDTQPELQIGDVIVAVDGENLNRRPIGQVLQPAPEYKFSIERPSPEGASESLERVLLQLALDKGDTRVLCTQGDDAEELADKLDDVVASLEASALNGNGGSLTSAAELDGVLADGSFWRLVVTSDPLVAKGGLTGFGDAPFCSLLGSFQLLKPRGDKEPTAQVVEVVANTNAGASTIAALKGGWDGADAGTADAKQVGGEAAASAVGVLETYRRTEYNGAPTGADAPPTKRGWACTYVSSALRVCRVHADVHAEGADGSTPPKWLVYQRLEATKAQNEIGRLLALPVERPADEIPEWVTRGGPPDWDQRGGGFGGGGYGGGPGPQPEPMRM